MPSGHGRELGRASSGSRFAGEESDDKKDNGACNSNYQRAWPFVAVKEQQRQQCLHGLVLRTRLCGPEPINPH